jgi:hypothetical protein
MAAVESKPGSPDPSLNSDANTAYLEIDPVLERRVMRKFDMFVIPQMMLLVILAYLDRSNIGTVALQIFFR